MGALLADRLAKEFLRLVAEGWDPDLDEFLSRVPEEHRGPCREQIEAQRAAEAAESEPEVEPVAEPVAQAAEEEGPLEFDLLQPLDEMERLAAASKLADEPEPAAEVEQALEAVDTAEAEGLDIFDVEEAAEPEPEPEPSGPQKLTPEEARALWPTQLERVNNS